MGEVCLANHLPEAAFGRFDHPFVHPSPPWGLLQIEVPLDRKVRTVPLHVWVCDDILDHLRCCLECLCIVRDDHKWCTSPCTESFETTHKGFSRHVRYHIDVNSTSNATRIEANPHFLTPGNTKGLDI